MREGETWDDWDVEVRMRIGTPREVNWDTTQGGAARDQRKQHEKSVRKFGNNVRSAANDNAGEKLRKHIAGNAAATMQEESQARNTIESEIRNEITDTQGKTSSHNL